MTKARKAEIARLTESGDWVHVTGSRRNIKETAFYPVISDLLEIGEVQDLQEFRHHKMTTRYQHCLNVAYYNYLVCRKLRLDAESAARAGLLHDLYHYDTHHFRKSATVMSHRRYHPMVALETAERVTQLNDLERDIIAGHMWPFALKHTPHYAESYIITFVDKYCAVIEFLLPQPARLRRWVINNVHAHTQKKQHEAVR